MENRAEPIMGSGYAPSAFIDILLYFFRPVKVVNWARLLCSVIATLVGSL